MSRSKSGAETIEMIPPVLTSIMTAPPRLPTNRLSASAWTVASTASVSAEPDCGATFSAPPSYGCTSMPWTLTSQNSRPTRPRRIGSYSASSPVFPIRSPRRNPCSSIRSSSSSLISFTNPSACVSRAAEWYRRCWSSRKPIPRSRYWFSWSRANVQNGTFLSSTSSWYRLRAVISPYRLLTCASGRPASSATSGRSASSKYRGATVTLSVVSLSTSKIPLRS